MLSTQATPLPTPSTAVPRHAWLALAVLLLGAGMSVLNSTIVTVALSSIQASLAASDTALAWIMSGWALAFGLTFIPAGRLGDRIGHKWIFFTGIALFTATSIACGAAENEGQLILFRVLQGIAGGLFFPTVTIYIQLLFTGRSRGTAFGLMAAVLAVASATGPLIGGLLIGAAGSVEGWRSVFLVNIPFGCIVLIATIFLLPNTTPRNKNATFDLLGLALLAAGLSAIIVPLVEGRSQGWPAWAFISLFAGFALLALFALWERRVEKAGGFALVPPRLYRQASFSAGTVIELCFYAAFVSIFYVLSIFWQAGLGFSPLATGLLSVPFAVGSIVSALASGRLSQRLGRGVLTIGTGTVVAGLGGLYVILATVPSTDLTGWEVAGPLLIIGLGSGLFLGPNVQFIVATVDRSEAGAAGGIVATMQRIGTAVGTAVVGSVLFGTLTIVPSGEAGPSGADIAVGFGHSAALAIGVCALFSLVAFALVFVLPKTISSPNPGVTAVESRGFEQSEAAVATTGS